MIRLELDKIACELVERALADNADRVKIDKEAPCDIFIESKITGGKHVSWTIQAHELDGLGKAYGPVTKWLVNLPIEHPEDMKATLIEEKG